LMTFIVLKQLHFMENKDLGLDRENIVSIHTSLWYEVADFKQDLLRNPDIKSVSMGSPIESFGEGNLEKKNGQAAIRWTDIDGKTDSLQMMEIWADGDFVKTFGLQLLILILRITGCRVILISLFSRRLSSMKQHGKR
jgi:putative ABC transport system permease protein